MFIFRKFLTSRRHNFRRVLRPDKSYFLKPSELWYQVDTGTVVQKILLKQIDIDKVEKIIKRQVPKGTHLPVTVKNTGRICNLSIFLGYKFKSCTA